MGFMISLICVYLNTYETFQWNSATLGGIFLIALPNTLWIANLMLANNILIWRKMKNNNRYNIGAHYLGKSQGLRLFVLLNIIAFVAILTAVVLHLAPWTMLLTFLVLPFVWKQTKLFMHKQIKRETFVCAVKILAVGACAQVISFAIGLIL